MNTAAEETLRLAQNLVRNCGYCPFCESASNFDPTRR